MSVSITSGSDLDVTTYFYLMTTFDNASSGAFQDEITEKSYKELLDRTYLGLGVLSLTLIPILFGGNFLVLLSLVIFRKLRSIQNCLIGCLASFDLLLSITALPTYVVGFWFSTTMMQYKYLCIFKYASVIFSCTGSLLSLLAIAVDRYIAVLHPLKYHLKMTKSKTIKIVAAIWTYSISIGVLPFFWNNKDKTVTKCELTEILPWNYVILSTFLFIPVAIISSTTLYVRIYQVAIRQKRKMLERRSRFDTASRRQLDRNTKSAFVMAIVLFFFVAFWLPFMVSGSLKFIEMEENLWEVIKSIALCIAQSNSGINPVIYCFLKMDFRIAFKLIFGRMRGIAKLNRNSRLCENKEGNIKIISNNYNMTNENIEMKEIDN